MIAAGFHHFAPEGWDGCFTKLVANDGSVRTSVYAEWAGDRLKSTGSVATTLHAMDQSAVHPPSTTRLVPVTSAEASEAR